MNNGLTYEQGVKRRRHLDFLKLQRKKKKGIIIIPLQFWTRVQVHIDDSMRKMSYLDKEKKNYQDDYRDTAIYTNGLDIRFWLLFVYVI